MHPALVHFPVVCWTAAPVLDAAYLLSGQLLWWQIGSACIALGLALGLAAMCAGFMDLMALPAGHPAGNTGQAHMLLVCSAWCLFVLDLVLRPLHAAPPPFLAWSAFGLALAGFLLLAAGAYAGARLVYDFGVGRNPIGTSHER